MEPKLATFFTAHYQWNECSLNAKRCLGDAMEVVRPLMKTGMQELNMPVLDPFNVPSFRYGLKFGNFTTLIDTRNTHVEKTSEFVLKDARLDTMNGTFVVDVMFPKLKIVSDCCVKLSILNSQQNFKGTFTVDAKNLDAKFVFKVDMRSKKVFCEIQDIKLNQKLEDYKVRFQFENDGGFNKLLNAILNRNRQSYIKSVMPMVGAKSNVLILDIIKNVLKSDPFHPMLAVA